jgi:hypothetical protein
MQLIKLLNTNLRQSAQMPSLPITNSTATINNEEGAPNQMSSSRVNLINDSATSTTQHHGKQIESRAAPKLSSSSKFLRMREHAEEEAKRHIDKLNKLMDKRLCKEKKIEANLSKLTKERLYRFGLREDKRQ